MATMLELPRELYLMVCSCLHTSDLTSLARLSRDHYLAVQQPLFRNINISSYDRLVKLLSAVLKVPVVSHITTKQRQYWHKLSDAELREREVKSLRIRLDSRKESRIVGAILERCIRGIAHKCPDVKIHLILYGVWRDGVKQLEGASFHNVKKLEVFAAAHYLDTASGGSPLRQKIYDIVFSGSTFPDLRDAYLNTYHDTAEKLPSTLEESLESSRFNDTNFSTSSVSASIQASNQAGATFHGLLNMEKIRLEYNTFLTPEILQSLFGSTIIPKRLTTVEITNCPHLHPIREMQAIATLLERGLQLLQHLKLHLTKYPDTQWSLHTSSYNAEVDEHPEHHLCYIVRQLGQKIKHLDLGVPFACNGMLISHAKETVHMQQDLTQLPDISLCPYNTLAQRVVAKGYRHRRLIIYNGICRGAHSFDEFVDLAADQGDRISWELLSEEEDKSMWCVSGCVPVEFAWEDAVTCALRDE